MTCKCIDSRSFEKTQSRPKESRRLKIKAKPEESRLRMKTIAFLLLIIGSFLLAANAAANKREKKSPQVYPAVRLGLFYVNRLALVQFGKMIMCETRKFPWSYNGYGCWCGKGGSGTPVDATDRCCKDHDRCYENLERSGVCWKNAWWYTPYIRYRCSECSRFNINCGKRLCQCDQAAARCFKRALSTYNSGFKGYRSRGFC
ncbi:phospholipase A2 'basic'-like [Dendronephthya gigantea]|uniref:phospholipase A2 'basic'-like n=1 Tax=Dendronephthya gigantea TaxID=151771 RepID=UPI001069A5B6|nr:phospholipase A2 'basic'-like [Dendronephthya gigantea]